MSLKEVIMTLNNFYDGKLSAVFSFLRKEKDYAEAVKQINENEIRIPYDEEIFTGIDTNYKKCKEILSLSNKLLPQETATS